MRQGSPGPIGCLPLTMMGRRRVDVIDGCGLLRPGRRWPSARRDRRRTWSNSVLVHPGRTGRPSGAGPRMSCWWRTSPVWPRKAASTTPMYLAGAGAACQGRRRRRHTARAGGQELAELIPDKARVDVFLGLERRKGLLASKAAQWLQDGRGVFHHGDLGRGIAEGHPGVGQHRRRARAAGRAGGTAVSRMLAAGGEQARCGERRGDGADR